MTKTKQKGSPSLAVVVITFISIAFAAVAVIWPCRDSEGLEVLGVVAMLYFWLFWLAPLLFKKMAPDKDLLCTTDIYTGFWGAFAWIAISHLFNGVIQFGGGVGLNYSPAGWWLGFFLAIFTSVIIGKMARHWGFLRMFVVGFLLGYGVIFLNTVAMDVGAPLASSFIPTLSIGWFAVSTGLMVVFISAVAQTDYHYGKSCELEYGLKGAKIRMKRAENGAQQFAEEMDMYEEELDMCEEDRHNLRELVDMHAETIGCLDEELKSEQPELADVETVQGLQSQLAMSQERVKALEEELGNCQNKLWRDLGGLMT